MRTAVACSFKKHLFLIVEVLLPQTRGGGNQARPDHVCIIAEELEYVKQLTFPQKNNNITNVGSPPAVSWRIFNCAIIGKEGHFRARNQRLTYSLYMLEGEDNLIRRAKKGEAEPFGQLYDHYIAPIYRFVLVKVNNRAEAEDLTHDVFLSAWQNLKGYKHKGFPFSSWLYQIARNKVIDHYRTRKPHASIENLDEDLLKVVGVVETNLNVVLEIEQVQKAITQLSPEQQDVIILKFTEDLSNEEIADALGKTEGAVRLLQHRAVNNLKALLWKKD